MDISKKESARPYVWMIWMVASAFYAYQYILRVMPNIMMGDIMERFDINAAAFGQFSGVYYLGYALMHMPIGILLDRVGPRKVLTGCMLITVLGMVPLIVSDHWIFPVMGRALVGMGSSAAILGVFKIIRMTFSEERFPRMLSLSVTIGLIGAIYGGAPVDYMLETMGFESVVMIFIGCGAILSVATYWLLPETENIPQGTALSSIAAIVSNRRVLSACFFAGLMLGPLEGFADVWGKLFFQRVYGFEGTLAASLPSMIFVGMCFGSPILNFIAEKCGSYLAPVIGSGVVMAAGFFALMSGVMPSWAISWSFVVVGVCCAYQVLAIYKVSTYVAEEHAGLATAFANMIIMTFGYAFHVAIGGVIQVFGGVESQEAVLYGIGVIPVTLAIGAMGFVSLLYWERGERAQRRAV